jgi:hypothetical protein
MTSFLRTLCAPTLAACFFVGCGGKTGAVEDLAEADAGAPPGVGQPDSSEPDSSQVETNPPDAGVCVSIDPSSYDVACNVDADCVTVGSGTICSGDCELCRGQYAALHDGVATIAISAAALAKYNADTSALESSCQVVEETMCTGFPAACVEHQCAIGQGG